MGPVSPDDARRALEILERVLSRPTAPFHEHRVREELEAVLRRAGLSTRLDAAGNLVARYRRGRARPVVLTAHMDHPGFELVSVRGRRARARWDGQVPPFALKGLRLALWSDGPDGRRGTARVLRGDGRRPGPAARGLELAVPEDARAGDFGHADLVPFRRAGGRVVSKALDDVAGCAAVAAALERLARERAPADATALFTRAEEVGFHGALAAARARSVPRAPLVVVECSRAVPGAEIGRGPVVRVGDRASVFDPDLAAACVEAARGLQKRDPSFRFQRRLMDGGTCEATAFGLAGWRAVCLALPLGNYHNAGPRGVAPEFIAEGDFLGAVSLLGAFAAGGLDPAGARRRLAAWTRGRFGPAEARRLRASRL